MKQIIKNILKNFGINRDSFIYKILKLLNPFIYLQLLKFILDNYKTFKDKLEIKVIENPIIQTISINGIKNKSIIRQLEDITKKSEKYPFLISNVNFLCLFWQTDVILEGIILLVSDIYLLSNFTFL